MKSLDQELFRLSDSIVPQVTQQRRVQKRGLFRSLLAFRRPPRKLRVTREGWIYILVTLGVGAAAINTGNNLMFLVLGLLLSLIVVSGVMSETTLRKIKVRRHLPHRVHAQTPSLIEVTLRNKKRHIPSYSVELEDLIEDWSTDKRCYFLKVAPKGKQTAAYRTVIPKRGALKFTGYRVATRFPFALFEKWREIEMPDDLVVYPELVTVPTPEGVQKHQQGDITKRLPGAGEDLHSLREHRPGDDVRAVHWRTTARRGQLMVRENEDEESSHLCIYLDNSRTGDASDDLTDPIVERAISIAASLVVERTSSGQGVQLAVRGGLGPKISPGNSPDRLLRYLALLDYVPADDPPPFGKLSNGKALLIAEASRTMNFNGAIIPLYPRREAENDEV